MPLKYPHIDPVAIHLGPLPIRWYSLAYLAGFLLGWRYLIYITELDQDRKDEPGRLSRLLIDEFLPWAVFGVIAGGRIGYILFYNLHMYLEHPAEMLKLWDGGMSFHGGALGTIIAMIIYSWRQKLQVLRLTDMVCCAVPIGVFFGRIANFVNGELYGRATNVPWAMIFPADPSQVPRHPSQLYEAGLEGLVLGLVLLVLIRNTKIRNRPGIVSGVFLCGYAFARMTIEFFREPDRQLGFIVGHATMGQLLSIPMVIFGLYLIARAIRRGDPAAPVPA